MYNRYIPQPDGTFRRNSVQDRNPPPRPEQPVPPPPPPPPVCDDSPGCEIPPAPCGPTQHMGAMDFLRRLLPKNLDTGDLLVILLLLLMASDQKENSTSALLTLALYLFL